MLTGAMCCKRSPLVLTPLLLLCCLPLVSDLQLVLVASAAASAMGVGAFFSLLAGLNLLSAAVGGQQIYRQVASSREAGSSMLPKLQQSSAVADDVADLHEDRGIGKAGSPAPVVLVVDACK